VTKARPSNLSASVRQRLLNLSKDRDSEAELVFTQYAHERLLYRLASSEYASQFVLKGAMLFAAWVSRPHRPTRDLDLLGYGEPSAERLKTVFESICRVEVEPDGLEFEADSIAVTDIREDQEYESHRVQLLAGLGTAKLKVQVDVGFGDIVAPGPEMLDYPTLLDFPAPHIRAYPPEATVAEKLHAMVALGIGNSRMKDFYDLRVMARELSFHGSTLVRAIRATFERRRTLVPDGVPIALTEEFAASPIKTTQWRAFLRRSRLEAETELPAVVADLREFLIPPATAAAAAQSFALSWTDGGPWD